MMTSQLSDKERKCVLIVAIDFGTTYSGVCFATSDNLDLKYIVKSWPSKDGSTFDSEKVPTRIAYTPDNRVQSWGFEIDHVQPRFQEFKLYLDKINRKKDSKLSQMLRESASLARTTFFTPTKLSIDFLKKLRECMESEVEHYMGCGALASMSVEYVITVPAIWSDPAKRLTQFCAQQAGLGNPKLITEPEAAMVYALEEMPADGFALGNTFTICDAGGGTVDLITYKVTSIEPLEVEELVQGDGDKCGSAFITRLFHDYIRNNHARLPTWNESQTASAVDWFDNRTKRKFDDKDAEVTVKVPGARDYHKRDISIKKHKLYIPSATIKAMFDQVVPMVFKLINEQRIKATAKGASITGVILVGGFCESPYLKEYLRTKLKSVDKDIKIIEPKNGWSAVVRGALSRALPIALPNPMIPRITQRVARRCYGIACSCIYNPRYHASEEENAFSFEADGLLYILCIHWFLNIGATIKENYRTIRNYEHRWPSTSTDPKDTTIRLRIVSWVPDTDTNTNPPLYASDPNIEIVNNLNVDLSIIPKSDLIGKSEGDTMYLECYPDVHITYHFATIEYQLYIGDKCYGEVQCGYRE